ncbi:MAG: hypothetical protein HFE63_01115 [Clostridiales bacterium]|nr:hypothetical protein [Clostridiales bacterium]
MDNANICSAEKKLTVNGKILGGMTFLTVLSQLPQVVDAGYSSLISRFIWVLGFAIAIFFNKTIVVSKKFTVALVMASILITFSCVQVFIIKSSFMSTLSSCILLSIFILLVSMSLGDKLREGDLAHIVKCYILSSLILALDLLFTTLKDFDLSSMVYVYKSKNSAAVILFTGFVLTMVYGFKKKRTFNNLVCFGVIGIFSLTILLLKTRAIIICFPIVLILFILFSPFGKKTKGIIIFISVVAVISLFNERVYDVVINQIVFNNRNYAVDDISSGRFDQWYMLGENLKNNWFIGDGKTEQESLILTALIQYGVFMGGYIILYSLWPLFYSLKRVKNVKNKHVFCLLCISTVYFVDAIFEQLAPFGPGVRCFYLWMLFGILMSNNRVSEVEKNEL